MGVKNIEISLQAIGSERNIENNSKKIAVEVIDEQTEIAIISSYVHPDIGTLKKAIESNEQRSVSIYRPTVDLASLDKTDIFIFYQPDASYEPFYKLAENSKSGIFTITGEKTDWAFLNDVQNVYSKESFDELEDVSPVLNPGFSLFGAEDFSINGYPPVVSNLGEVEILSNAETLLYQKIKGTEIDEPLLTLIDHDNRRQAIFFGQNIWKWRMASFREFQNFENFDALIGKIMLFLSSNPTQERLNVGYENIYEGSYTTKISASVFDKAFEFDSNAELLLTTIETTSKRQVETPMVLKGGILKPIYLICLRAHMIFPYR